MPIKNNITIAATANPAGPSSPAELNAPPEVPVSHIRNTPVMLTAAKQRFCDALDQQPWAATAEQRFFDALDQQPWAATAEQRFYDAPDQQPWLKSASSWPTLNSLAAQVKTAIHCQLSLLSRSALASGLLSVIHPDLSKLLAAVLICSRQHQDMLCQTALTGGFELLNKLIYTIAGATSVAAALSTLPGLLVIWLQRQQISLATGMIEALSLLLACGLNICASEDLAQPGWLIKLHDEVIEPVMRLCRQTGVTETVTLGFTLILGIYTMLRLCGWLEGKTPPPNAISHGFRILADICRLSGISHHHQQHRDRRLAEAGDQKALARAVIRCMPRDQLLQHDARGQSSDREAMNQRAHEKFMQAWQQTEREILSGQSPRCAGAKVLLPTNPAASSSERPAAASAPLLISGAMVAGVAAQTGWQPGRAGWALAAAGTTLMALTGTHYLRHTRSAGGKSPLPKALHPSGNLCLDTTVKVRQLLRSDNTGVPLAVELFDYLFDKNDDLNFARANNLLKSWNITQFSSSDRTKMNSHLLYVLSLLLRRNDKDNPMDLRKAVLQMRHTVNFIWSMMLTDRKVYTVTEILNKLRLRCNNIYLTLGINSQSGMQRITDFLISHISPDLLIFERNGKGDITILSKEMYYLWNYIGNHLSDDQYIMNGEFAKAIIEGRMDGFVIARLRSYPFYNTTAKREVMESLYEHFNRDIYNYHKQDKKLEGITILTLDDIIQNKYPDIDLHKQIFSDYDYFLIHTKSPFGEESRILFRCDTYRDIIRNFEDGFQVLYYYFPNKIPQSLRHYSGDDRRSFTLKAHPKLSELYQQFNEGYQEMIDQHTQLYGDVVNRSLKIIPEDDRIFLESPATKINIITITAKRLKTLRYIFYPKTFRLNHQSLIHPYYNTRPYYETGVFFFCLELTL